MKKGRAIVFTLLLAAMLLLSGCGGRETTLEAELAEEAPFDEIVRISVITNASLEGVTAMRGQIVEPEQVQEFLDLLREIKLVDEEDGKLCWNDGPDNVDPSERIVVGLLCEERGIQLYTDGDETLQIDFDGGANLYRLHKSMTIELLRLEEFMFRHGLFEE